MYARTLLLAVIVAIAPTAWADSISIDTGDVRIVLTDHERDIIREYYRQLPAPPAKPLNKGMQKRLEKGKSLPPGWQKKLVRGAVIPADIWAWHEPLPHDVLVRLPPQPEGVITVRIDSQIVRVIAATHVLLDAFAID
ncbi:hypothetical protein SAMN04488120_10489 [Fontimonas thermophila]|uniref:Nickel/cobalt transporter regulator n=1 Tax=Fontimonas thermophila TaxID=1076937 RepID=A0A1I2IP91_9GAMM|nr:hypothetical protein [Fontimonas thermophila]SFF43453.1 hypothetical protein SAMN04488120_10489 [Fontimonas thermophila]